jgi:hypothetical protein
MIYETGDGRYNEKNFRTVTRNISRDEGDAFLLMDSEGVYRICREDIYDPHNELMLIAHYKDGKKVI